MRVSSSASTARAIHRELQGASAKFIGSHARVASTRPTDGLGNSANEEEKVRASYDVQSAAGGSACNPPESANHESRITNKRKTRFLRGPICLRSQEPRIQ